jgi:hypothetical protein
MEIIDPKVAGIQVVELGVIAATLRQNELFCEKPIPGSIAIA